MTLESRWRVKDGLPGIVRTWLPPIPGSDAVVPLPAQGRDRFRGAQFAGYRIVRIDLDRGRAERRLCHPIAIHDALEVEEHLGRRVPQASFWYAQFTFSEFPK